jgi:hypothetical protein
MRIAGTECAETDFWNRLSMQKVRIRILPPRHTPEKHGAPSILGSLARERGNMAVHSGGRVIVRLAMAGLLAYGYASSANAELLLLDGATIGLQSESGENKIDRPASGRDRLPSLTVLAEADKAIPSETKAKPAASASQPFLTLPPGAKLPSDSVCAAKVRRTGWEPRPQNAAANQTRGRPGAAIDGADPSFNKRYGTRVEGNFVGTTDEIIQWAACKWGFSEDITRARAMQESHWRQSQLGDKTDNPAACATIAQAAPCWQSYGILQVKGTVHEDTYPAARDSTAYNVDYALAWLRACYEGAFSDWMGNGYRAGDEWGCVGAWYSGNWYDSGARKYIDGVKRHLANRAWTQAEF